jgi:hypothetical protein
MIKSVMREAALAIQSKTGASEAVFIWLAVAVVAALLTVVFLCVAAFVWLEGPFGGVIAGLILAGCFLLVAAIALLSSALARRQARNRAILERAARAHGGSWLLDPKFLATAVQIGRSIGWQRLLPVALLGIVAAQWAREHRSQNAGEETE